MSRNLAREGRIWLFAAQIACTGIVIVAVIDRPVMLPLQAALAWLDVLGRLT